MVSIFVGNALGRFTGVKSIVFMGCNSSLQNKKSLPKNFDGF